jgi:hypothetical protein
VVPAESFLASVLRCLVAGGARFVVVGGVAVNLQGVPRFTADLDVAIALEPATLRAVTRGLTALGLRPRLPVPAAELEDVVTVKDWIENRNLQAITFQDPRDPLRQVDALVGSRLSFDEIEASAETLTMLGLPIPVASIETLIRMKDGTGRQQDASDVVALRRVRRLREGDD